MKKFKTKEEALASQNFDPSKVTITGVPERHLEAVKSIINLFVGYDAVNPDFQADFTDYNKLKYENVYKPGSRSGRGFSYYDYDYWYSVSCVGSRLVSESPEAAEHIDELFHEDFKNLMVYQRKTE